LKELLPLDLENFLKMSFRSFSHWWFDGFKWYLVYRCIMKGCRLSSNMGAVWLLLEEVAFSYIFNQLPQNCWNDFTESW
jgi:hypothetical protein